jgi:hypothetical protein
LRAYHGVGRDELDEWLVAAAKFEGHFSNVTRGDASKAVLRQPGEIASHRDIRFARG